MFYNIFTFEGIKKVLNNVKSIENEIDPQLVFTVLVLDPVTLNKIIFVHLLSTSGKSGLGHKLFCQHVSLNTFRMATILKLQIIIKHYCTVSRFYIWG